MKTIEYPLLALTLIEDEYAHIMAPVLMGGLPNIGVCKSIPRSLVYAPLKYQGLDIHNLYTTQRLSYIKGLLNHIWQGTTIGKLLKISLEYAMIEVGLGGLYFNDDYKVYVHLGEDTWIKHLWKFLFDTGIQLYDITRDFKMV